MKNIENLIDVALNQRPADLVIKNAQVFNPFLGRFIEGDVAICDGLIAGVGHYDGQETVDAEGDYLTAGFFDAHVHIESGMASPQEFTRTLVARGTTTIVADPHEIANVAGVAGIDYILRATENAPVNVYVMLPSCVPATPLESGGATLTAEDLAPFINHPRVLGLGEMMNFPGVLGKDQDVIKKLNLFKNHPIDGHSPGLSGPPLTAYAAAGISSDHECMTPAEVTERLALGMGVMLREGSATRNLINLLPAVTAANAPFCMMATDDRHPEDLIEQGHINYLARLAAADGRLEKSVVLKLATFNGPRHYGLKNLGAIAPGYRADLALFPNLDDFKPRLVWKDGRLAAKNGECLWAPHPVDESAVRLGLKLPPLTKEMFKVKAGGSHLKVIGLIPGEIVTKSLTLTPSPVNGEFVADPEADLIKVAVLERYRNTGHVGLGFLKGLGLKRGAIASTVAHDSHNLVVAGATDEDMLAAVSEIKRIGGGLAVTKDGQVLDSLPLPLGGLLSDRPMAEIKNQLASMQQAVRDLGLAEGHDPFMTLAFMSLPVIPQLKLTEAGLVDVEKFEIVPLSF